LKPSRRFGQSVIALEITASTQSQKRGSNQPDCQRSKWRRSAAGEHRAGIELASPRYDGGILPLDEQCFIVVL